MTTRSTGSRTEGRSRPPVPRTSIGTDASTTMSPGLGGWTIKLERKVGNDWMPYDSKVTGQQRLLSLLQRPARRVPSVRGIAGRLGADHAGRRLSLLHHQSDHTHHDPVRRHDVREGLPQLRGGRGVREDVRAHVRRLASRRHDLLGHLLRSTASRPTRSS